MLDYLWIKQIIELFKRQLDDPFVSPPVKNQIGIVIEHVDWARLKPATWLATSIMDPIIELMRRECPSNVLFLPVKFVAALFGSTPGNTFTPSCIHQHGNSPFKV